MATLLKWVGGIWAVIGVGNLIGMPWTTAGQELLITAGLMLNVLLFVVPGLIVYGIGSAITKKQAPAAVPAEPKKSVESRLQELAALRDKGLVSAEEFEARRKQLLNEV
ncbi:MAG: SHOCT domain-containing protein [Candidatus Micrarchaeota archaeon]